MQLPGHADHHRDDVDLAVRRDPSGARLHRHAGHRKVLNHRRRLQPDPAAVVRAIDVLPTRRPPSSSSRLAGSTKTELASVTTTSTTTSQICRLPASGVVSKSQNPNPKVQIQLRCWSLDPGAWGLGFPAYFDSASGRTWNLMIFAVVPLPPSMWNGARVAKVV